MAATRYGYGGGDYSQQGQDYSQFSPFRQRRPFQNQESQAVDSALGGSQYTPPTGGINPSGQYSGGTTPPARTTPAAGTTAADQLSQQQQATQQALAVPKPNTAQLWQSTARRGGRSGGSVWGGAATGASLGSTFGPIGMGVGALAGAITGAALKRAPTAPTDFSVGNAQQLISEAYREYLGREASPQEIATHLQNVGWEPGDKYVGEMGLQHILENAISSSPEALAYANRASSTAPASTPASGTTTQAAAPSSSAWDTDGYPTPGYIAPNPGQVPAGWDATNWANPNMQTPKYVVGRILSQYPTTIEGLKQATAEIQKAYPGTTFDGKDKLTLPGMGTVDVLVNASSSGGTGWAWQPLTNPDGSPVAGANSPGSPGGGVDTSWAYGGAMDTTRALIQKLMQELAVAGSLK